MIKRIRELALKIPLASITKRLILAIVVFLLVLYLLEKSGLSIGTILVVFLFVIVIYILYDKIYYIMEFIKHFRTTPDKKKTNEAESQVEGPGESEQTVSGPQLEVIQPPISPRFKAVEDAEYFRSTFDPITATPEEIDTYIEAELMVFIHKSPEERKILAAQARELHEKFFDKVTEVENHFWDAVYDQLSSLEQDIDLALGNNRDEKLE